MKTEQPGILPLRMEMMRLCSSSRRLFDPSGRPTRDTLTAVLRQMLRSRGICLFIDSSSGEILSNASLSRPFVLFTNLAGLKFGLMLTKPLWPSGMDFAYLAPARRTRAGTWISETKVFGGTRDEGGADQQGRGAGCHEGLAGR